MPTAAQFRTIALSFPETVEKSHFGNADFRVKEKIFAGLSSERGKDKESRGSLKLTPEIQASVLGDESFSPAAGAWGRSGWTYVDLATVSLAALRGLLEEAWRIVAPKTLVAERDGGARKTAPKRAAAPKKKPGSKKSSPKRTTKKKTSRAR